MKCDEILIKSRCMVKTPLSEKVTYNLYLMCFISHCIIVGIFIDLVGMPPPPNSGHKKLRGKGRYPCCPTIKNITTQLEVNVCNSVCVSACRCPGFARICINSPIEQKMIPMTPDILLSVWQPYLPREPWWSFCTSTLRASALPIHRILLERKITYAIIWNRHSFIRLFGTWVLRIFIADVGYRQHVRSTNFKFLTVRQSPIFLQRSRSPI